MERALFTGYLECGGSYNSLCHKDEWYIHLGKKLFEEIYPEHMMVKDGVKTYGTHVFGRAWVAAFKERYNITIDSDEKKDVGEKEGNGEGEGTGSDKKMGGGNRPGIPGEIGGMAKQGWVDLKHWLST